MGITEFEWDDNNIEHIACHQVMPEEAEEVFGGAVMIRRTRSGYYTAWGRSLAGRYLFVVYSRLSPVRARVITARDMTRTERKFYGSRK